MSGFLFGFGVVSLLAWFAGLPWLLAATVVLGLLLFVFLEGAYRVWDEARKAPAPQAVPPRVEYHFHGNVPGGVVVNVPESRSASTSAMVEAATEEEPPAEGQS